MKESDNQWKIMRRKYDKQFPNGFTTASNVWSTIVYYQDDNWKRVIPSSYFSGENASLIRPEKEHGFVKSMMYKC